jgi:hypothetical protein
MVIKSYWGRKAQEVKVFAFLPTTTICCLMSTLIKSFHFALILSSFFAQFNIYLIIFVLWLYNAKIKRHLELSTLSPLRRMRVCMLGIYFIPVVPNLFLLMYSQAE